MGDTTNVAARLQASPPRARSSSARRRRRPDPHVRPRAARRRDGEGPPGVRERVASDRAQAGLRATGARPLIDREAEMAAPADSPRRAASAAARSSSCSARRESERPAFWSSCDRQASGRVTWLEGHCLSYGAEIAVRPAHPDAEGLDRGRGRRGSPRRPDEAPGQARPAARLRSPETSCHTSRTCSRSSSIRPRRSARAAPRPGARARDPPRLPHVGRRLAEQGPVVVAIEDVHWADPASLELVEELLELTDRRRSWL